MTRDYCFVKDIVQGNLLALERCDEEIVNLGTGRESTTGELYREVLKALRAKGFAQEDKFDSPDKGAARLGDLHRSCLDALKAEKKMEWSAAYDLRNGIEETVQYWVSENTK